MVGGGARIGASFRPARYKKAGRRPTAANPANAAGMVSVSGTFRLFPDNPDLIAEPPTFTTILNLSRPPRGRNHRFSPGQLRHMSALSSGRSTKAGRAGKFIGAEKVGLPTGSMFRPSASAPPQHHRQRPSVIMTPRSVSTPGFEGV